MNHHYAAEAAKYHPSHRSSYPHLPCFNEEFDRLLHHPMLARHYDSPSQLVLPSPIAGPLPHQVLSVYKSASKSKRASGRDCEPQNSSEQQECNVAAERARAALLHPRQLNFNDENVDAVRTRITFEDVDADREQYGPAETVEESNQGSKEEADPEEEHFEVVKIKLNSHHRDHRPRLAPSQRALEQSKPTDNSKAASRFVIDTSQAEEALEY